VRKALKRSQAPAEIATQLITSVELAPLWNQLSEAQRANIEVLPDYLGFVLWGGKRLPWSEQWTVSEQRAHAKRVSRLARELDRELAAFAPLDPFRLHQVFPQADNSKHFFLGGLPPIAVGRSGEDSLLLRIATMADRFKPERAKRIRRPTRKDAWDIYFVRTLAPLFDDPIGHEFLAGLANVFTDGEWDAERVKKSLTRSRIAK
jgi:hypothetical protein